MTDPEQTGSQPPNAPQPPRPFADNPSFGGPLRADEGKTDFFEETGGSDIYDPVLDAVEHPQHPDELVAKIEERLAETRERVRQFGVSSHGKGPIEVVHRLSEQLSTLLLSDRVQESPGSISLGIDSYDLLAYRLNTVGVPTYEELSGFRKVLQAQYGLPADPRTTESVRSVIEKTDPNYWLLSSEEREFLERVIYAPDLKVDETRRNPVEASKEGLEARIIKSIGKVVKRVVAPPRHPEIDTSPPPKFDTKKYLSPEEIARVKRELWYGSSYQDLNPNLRLMRERPAAILGSAQETAFARLQLDEAIRREIEREV